LAVVAEDEVTVALMSAVASFTPMHRIPLVTIVREHTGGTTLTLTLRMGPCSDGSGIIMI
jgi:hypothetical protein